MYKLSAAAGALLALTTGTALAQNADDGNNEGFYIGAGLGDFSTEINDIDDVDDVDLDFDEDEDASKIFAGWRFMA